MMLKFEINIPLAPHIVSILHDLIGCVVMNLLSVVNTLLWLNVRQNDTLPMQCTE